MLLLEKLKKNENIWCAFIFSFLFFSLLGYALDFYYDLNDDVLMKDILAGVYTGEPESRNIQMLYPLSLFLSWLYRLLPAVSWYGVFLCGCHFFCTLLMTERLLGFCEGRLKKSMALAAEALFLAAYVLRDLVFVQYTFTSAMLASAAAFLVMTGKKTNKKDEKYFLSGCIPGIILAILAFLLRSEMLLLLLPFLCTAGIFRWSEESSPVFSKENVRKYFLTAGILFAGILVSLMIHSWGYRSSEWRNFQAFFDSRTELYDFQTIPAYQDNREFYESIGMSESRQILLENYNFGMDDELDAECLEKIAGYAKDLKREQTDFWSTCREALKNYKYRTFHETDYPWNLAVLVLYMGVFAAMCVGARFRSVWKLVFLGFLRTGIWLFILFRGRVPERITHSLYLMEFTILLALLLSEIRRGNRKARRIRAGIIAVPVILALAAVPGSLQKTWWEYGYREEINSRMQALESYVSQRQEEFYFIDVYSTVAYSEKLFEPKSQGLSNYDLMGGWAVKSPLNRKKLDAFLIEDMGDAVLNRADVFVIVQEPESPNFPTLEEWVTSYYEEKGQEVLLRKKDGIYVGKEAVFTVYRVEKKEE